MAVLSGNSFTIIVNTQDSDHLAFAHTQSCSFSFSNQIVEATLGPTEGWTEFLSGKKTASISFSGLQDHGSITDRRNVDDLADYLLDENLLYFQVGNNANYALGKGYISEITLEGGTDDVATYSGVLVVTEEVSNERATETEILMDSDGNTIFDDAGDPILVNVFI